MNKRLLKYTYNETAQSFNNYNIKIFDRKEIKIMNKNDTKKTKVKSNKEINSMNKNENFVITRIKEYSIFEFQNLCNTINKGLLNKGYCYFHTYVEIDYMDIVLYAELFDAHENYVGVIQFEFEKGDGDYFVLVPYAKAVKKADWTIELCASYLGNFYFDIIDILTK